MLLMMKSGITSLIFSLILIVFGGYIWCKTVFRINGISTSPNYRYGMQEEHRFSRTLEQFRYFESYQSFKNTYDFPRRKFNRYWE